MFLEQVVKLHFVLNGSFMALPVRGDNELRVAERDTAIFCKARNDPFLCKDGVC